MQACLLFYFLCHTYPFLEGTVSWDALYLRFFHDSFFPGPWLAQFQFFFILEDICPHVSTTQAAKWPTINPHFPQYLVKFSIGVDDASDNLPPVSMTTALNFRCGWQVTNISDSLHLNLNQHLIKNLICICKLLPKTVGSCSVSITTLWRAGTYNWGLLAHALYLLLLSGVQGHVTRTCWLMLCLYYYSLACRGM